MPPHSHPSGPEESLLRPFKGQFLGLVTKFPPEKVGNDQRIVSPN